MAQQIMRKRVLIWIILVLLHLLLLGLAIFTHVLRDTAVEAFGLTVVMIPYALDAIGLPVLENNGSGGWGWLSPNLFGFFLSAIFWLSFYWLIALGMVRLFRLVSR
jgi:quinol-cytochrome oxidoreductase complex cytochrome b subunit